MKTQMVKPSAMLGCLQLCSVTSGANVVPQSATAAAVNGP